MKKSTFSPGKVIISGEHSVIYGQPAIVGGISLGIKSKAEVTSQGQVDKTDAYQQFIFDVFLDYLSRKGRPSFKIPPMRNNYELSFPELKLIVESSLPQKSGLGSSAAFAHSVFLSLADFFQLTIDEFEMFELVWQAEKYIHGQSSGIDPAAVVYGGLIHFEKSQIKSIGQKPFSEAEFLLVHSGDAEESTGEMVARVAHDQSEFKQRVISSIGKVTKKIARQLQKQNTFDYSLLTENQNLLDKLGVVGQKARQIVNEIEDFGGVAKVTGAGGTKSGSGFLLSWHQNMSELINFVEDNSWNYRKLTIGV